MMEQISFETEVRRKLSTLYASTHFPVSLINEDLHFELLHPGDPFDMTMYDHGKFLKDCIDQAQLPLYTPMVLHILQSTYFSIIRITETLFIQIGPIASKHINFTEYIANLNSLYGPSVSAQHVGLLQSCPRVDLNYFVQVNILATQLLCNRDIQSSDVVYADELVPEMVPPQDISVEFAPANGTSIFSEKFYHAIQEGDEQTVTDGLKEACLCTRYAHLESCPEVAYIVYVSCISIALNHAAMGGVSNAILQEMFVQATSDVKKYDNASLYWNRLIKELPKFCKEVQAVKCLPGYSEPVRLSVTYINQNVYNRVSGDDLERVTGVSKRTLQRHFLRDLGRTPAEYIMEVRMQEASKLLLQSGIEITEISTMLGFSSQSHFTSAFRKHFECTPLQYRYGKRGKN